MHTVRLCAVVKQIKSKLNLLDICDLNYIMVSVDKMFMASLDNQVIAITVCTSLAHVQCMYMYSCTDKLHVCKLFVLVSEVLRRHVCL